jgi:hypothetical protein
VQGLALICLLTIFPSLTTSPDPPGLLPLHEGAWGICPGHGGGGRPSSEVVDQFYVARLPDLAIRYLVPEGRSGCW